MTSLLQDYLTPEQLADELEKSERTLARWHRLREGPPRTLIGKRIVYRRDAVKAWLLAREQNEVAA